MLLSKHLRLRLRLQRRGTPRQAARLRYKLAWLP
jgi:hypothetical protein